MNSIGAFWTDPGSTGSRKSVEEVINDIVDIIVALKGQKGLQYLDRFGKTVRCQSQGVTIHILASSFASESRTIAAADFSSPESAVEGMAGIAERSVSRTRTHEL